MKDFRKVFHLEMLLFEISPLVIQRDLMPEAGREEEEEEEEGKEGGD